MQQICLLRPGQLLQLSLLLLQGGYTRQHDQQLREVLRC
jgi:hypothetical protein